jgi:hypothetical protein
MKKYAIAAALAALLTACTQSATEAPAPTQVTTVKVVAPDRCDTDFIEVTTTASACGIAIGADGSLTAGQRHYPPIAVSYTQGAGGQIAIPAKKLILFPPRAQDGTRIIQACEDTDPNSLCWAVRLMNPQSNTLREISAGKYGPDRWIGWSIDESYVALFSRNDGADWLHVIDSATGVATTYPAETENTNWQIERDTFAWTSDNAFTVTVKTCESCAPEARNFTLP